MSNPTELPDLDRLEALARAATPGTWLHRRDPSNHGAQHCVKLAGEHGAWICDCLDNADRSVDGGVAGERNASFIAAANPAAVLALIALARRAKPEGEAHGTDGDNMMRRYGPHVKALIAAGNGPGYTKALGGLFAAISDHVRAKQEGEACQHQHHHFGTEQPRRRCVRCDKLEPEGEAPQAELLKKAARLMYNALNDAYQGHILDDDDMKTAGAALAAYGRYCSAPAAQHAESGALESELKRRMATYAAGHEAAVEYLRSELAKDRAALAAQSQGAQAAMTAIARRDSYIAELEARAAQQAAAPGAVDLLNADELAALRRFDECAQDGEGYDVPKEMMQRLAQIGVLRRTSGNFYEHTAFGLRVLDQPAHSAPGTPEAPARDDVLEEAALACEAWGNEKVSKWADDPEMSEDAKARAWDGVQCAVAIRKLKGRAAQLDGGQGEGKAHG